MPRPRKYDYQKDLPDTIFIEIPLYLKKELQQMLTKKELNELISAFLLDFVEKNKK